MSPKYSLALVLAVTLFLTATSLTDVKPQPTNKPSITLDNELAKPKKPPHKGNGHDQPHVKEAAMDVDSKPRPGGDHGGSHVNELAATVKPPNGGHGGDINEEAAFINNRTNKVAEYDVSKDSSIDEGKHKPGGPQHLEAAKQDKKKSKPKIGHGDGQLHVNEGTKPPTGN